MLKSSSLALQFLVPPTPTFIYLLSHSFIHFSSIPFFQPYCRCQPETPYSLKSRGDLFEHPILCYMKFQRSVRYFHQIPGELRFSWPLLYPEHQYCLRFALTPTIHGWWTLSWWFGMGNLFLLILFIFLFLSFYLFLLPLFWPLFIWNKYWSFSQFDEQTLAFLHIRCL